MATSADIPSSVHSLFPKSANRLKRIAYAFHPERAGSDHPVDRVKGWEPVNELATRANLVALKARGYTLVNIQAGGVPNPFRDAPIDRLLG